MQNRSWDATVALAGSCQSGAVLTFAIRLTGCEGDGPGSQRGKPGGLRKMSTWRSCLREGLERGRGRKEKEERREK